MLSFATVFSKNYDTACITVLLNSYNVLYSMHYLTVQRHCTENSKQIFLEMKLRGLVPNFRIHVSVIDLYIFTIRLPIFCSKIGGPIVSFLGIQKSDLLCNAERQRFLYL
jgi:hypothetical protein